MSIITRNIRQYGMVIALVAIAVLFQILTDGVLFRPANITNLILQNSYILILAIGMTLVIVTGRIDLSVGSIAALAGGLAGVLIIQANMPVWLTIIIVLAAGGLLGAWQGFWIAYRNIPFFVVTLAGMLVFRGLTMIILDGRMIGPFPTSFQIMAAGFVPDIFGGTDINIMAVAVCGLISLIFIAIEIRNRRVSRKYEVDVLPMPFFIAKIVIIVGAISLFGYWLGASNGIPTILVLLGVLIVVYSYVANRTIMGRHIYATGGNAKAAELSGIKIKRVVFWVYVNMGVLAALAGLVFTARLNSAMPRAGSGFELEAIAAAFIGGASPAGGVGKVAGAIVGAMVVGILNNGMSIMGVPVAMRQVVMGLALLAAVIFDVLSKQRAAKTTFKPNLSSE